MVDFDDEDALTDWLHSEGVLLSEAVLPKGLTGLWQPEKRRILIRAGQPASYRFPALLHEATHYAWGHYGHQSEKVEQSINRQIARRLINPAEYVAAENRYGWNTRAIAIELGVPRWVVQAYRSSLVPAYAERG